MLDDMIADMESNKKLSPVITELFLRRRFYTDFSKEPYSFLVNDTTLSSDNPLLFRKNLL